jgi:YegS/Rv2252/BmrU family lipid kinase
MESALFVNLHASRGRAAPLCSKISHRLQQGGLRLSVSETRSPAGLIDQVLIACQDGARTILIAGGDGSVNEAINGIMEADARPRFGVIPIGAGNDFVKAVGIPIDWRKACDVIITGMDQPESDATIDVGRCNERFFLNSIGVGYDAEVALKASLMKWPAGQARYPLALARSLMRGIKNPLVKIVTEEANLELPITLVSVMNGRIAGGMFPLAPTAKIDDGYLDIVVAIGMNRRQVLRLLPRLMAGTHLSLPGVSLLRSRVLTLESDEPLHVQADGEILTANAHKLNFELLPGRLSVIGGRLSD